MELIPINVNVHYKTAFDVHSSSDKSITELRKKIKKWCLTATRNCDNKDLHSAWFFKGDGEQHKIGSYLFRACTNIGDYSQEEPEHWAIEIIHPDRDHRNRKWSIEITMSRVDHHLIRFATTLKNWITEGYIGEIPPKPTLTTPGFVRDIINMKGVVCRKGDEELNSKPVTIKQGDGKVIFEKITSANRHLPLILISKESEIDDYCIPHDELQKNIIGNANLYLLESESVNKEVNYFLGNNLSCLVGSLRIYMPKVRLNNERDPYRHRFYSRKDIFEFSKEKVIREITIGLSRNARTFTTKEILTTYDVISARRRHKIKDLLRQKSRNPEQEEELKLLWEEIEELERNIKYTEEQNEACQTEMEQYQQENSSLKWRISQYDKLREEKEALKNQANVMDKLVQLPKGLPEVINVISEIFPSKIAFTERAHRSAKEYKNGNDTYMEAWEMLVNIAMTLHDIIFNKQGVDIEKEFKTRSGYELTMTEGRQTKRDSSLMRLREDHYNGKEIDITPHVKFGNKEPKILRIHFYPDEENRLIVIGHCGEHIDNYTTRTIS